MKSLCLSAMILGLVCSCINIRTAKPPVLSELTLDSISVDVDAYREEYGKYDGVFLGRHTTIKHLGEHKRGGDWFYHEVIRRSYIVFDPETEWLTTTKFYRLPEQLLLRMTLPDGAVRSFGSEVLEETLDDRGRKIYVFVYPGVEPGTLIQEAFESAHFVQWYAPLEHYEGLEFMVPCEQVFFEYLYPNWWTLKIKRISEDGALPVDISEDVEQGQKRLAYKAEDVPAIDVEYLAPPIRSLARYLDLMVMKLDMGLIQGYERTTNWADIAQMYYEYIYPKAPEESRDVRKAAQRVVEGATTATDTAVAVLSFVRDSIAHSSEGLEGHYKAILKAGKGDVFDRTGLTSQMFRELGCRSHILMVHSADDGYFDPGFVDPDQMYTPVVSVGVGDQHFYVFPYMEHLSAGWIPSAFLGQQALMIDAGDRSHMVTLPQSNAEPSSSRHECQVRIEESGDVHIVERREITGLMALGPRNQLAELTTQDRDMALEEEYAFDDQALKVTRSEVKHLHLPELPLVMEFEYDASDWLTITPEEVILRSGHFFSPLGYEVTDVDSHSRRYPIQVRSSREVVRTYEVSYPKSWRVSDVGEGKRYSNEFGTVEGSFAADSGMLHIDYSLRMPRTYKPPESVSELESFLDVESSLELPTILFERMPQP